VQRDRILRQCRHAGLGGPIYELALREDRRSAAVGTFSCQSAVRKYGFDFDCVLSVDYYFGVVKLDIAVRTAENPMRHFGTPTLI
jgi:hypothetical protein